MVDKARSVHHTESAKVPIRQAQCKHQDVWHPVAGEDSREDIDFILRVGQSRVDVTQQKQRDKREPSANWPLHHPWLGFCWPLESAGQSPSHEIGHVKDEKAVDWNEEVISVVAAFVLGAHRHRNRRKDGEGYGENGEHRPRHRPNLLHDGCRAQQLWTRVVPVDPHHRGCSAPVLLVPLDDWHVQQDVEGNIAQDEDDDRHQEKHEGCIDGVR
mmetsp:Transcript_32867/g.86042  ORF Transcript_32867/g.86042 Transcript_32867/m.86042 type:complete len:214 (-) Transcript_32867:688-1329(-)